MTDEIRKETQKSLLDIALLFALSGELKPEEGEMWARRCLDLAGLVFPEDNARVGVFKFQMEKKALTAPKQDLIAAALSRSIFQLSKSWRASESEREQGWGNHMVELAAQLDPRHEAAVLVFVELTEAKKIADWNKLTEKPGGQVATSGPKESFNTGGRRKASISSLLISQTASGNQVGMVNDLIATVQDTHKDKVLNVTFNQEVGKQMSTALEEALRMIETRLPGRATGYTITLGFEDKYTPKDGGSAGTACSLLILSLLEDQELDENLAVTGDITADGKVRRVGGVRIKSPEQFREAGKLWPFLRRTCRTCWT
ncbi:MAG: hypothetical protein HC904_07115 [Blastochloris sp.]|nr:hypothetical protein [Blastochloris sp.]